MTGRADRHGQLVRRVLARLVGMRYMQLPVVALDGRHCIHCEHEFAGCDAPVFVGTSRRVRLYRCGHPCILEVVDHPDLEALFRSRVPDCWLWTLGLNDEPDPAWLAGQPRARLTVYGKEPVTTGLIPAIYALAVAEQAARLGLDADVIDEDLPPRPASVERQLPVAYITAVTQRPTGTLLNIVLPAQPADHQHLARTLVAAGTQRPGTDVCHRRDEVAEVAYSLPEQDALRAMPSTDLAHLVDILLQRGQQAERDGEPQLAQQHGACLAFVDSILIDRERATRPGRRTDQSASPAYPEAALLRGRAGTSPRASRKA